MQEKTIKPWGSYQNLLDCLDCKVKKIIISPSHRPSYQYHFKREEIWVVVKGRGLVTIDDKETLATKGSVIKVPTKAKHRIQNIGDEDLIFIEVQLGTYFGEDDIIRVHDDYKR